MSYVALKYDFVNDKVITLRFQLFKENGGKKWGKAPETQAKPGCS